MNDIYKTPKTSLGKLPGKIGWKGWLCITYLGSSVLILLFLLVTWGQFSIQGAGVPIGQMYLSITPSALRILSAYLLYHRKLWCLPILIVAMLVELISLQMISNPEDVLESGIPLKAMPLGYLANLGCTLLIVIYMIVNIKAKRIS